MVDRLNAALRRAAAVPAFEERLANEGLDASVSSPEGMTKFKRAEEARWRRIIAGKQISID